MTTYVYNKSIAHILISIKNLKTSKNWFKNQIVKTFFTSKSFFNAVMHMATTVREILWHHSIVYELYIGTLHQFLLVETWHPPPPQLRPFHYCNVIVCQIVSHILCFFFLFSFISVQCFRDRRVVLFSPPQTKV